MRKMIQLLWNKPRLIFSFYLCLRLTSPNYAFMRHRLYSKQLQKVKEYMLIIYSVIFCTIVTHLLFWYQVFTCVSDRFSFAANSILSCTLRYFCLSKLFSKLFNWWSENAVLAFLCFFALFDR